MQMDVAVLIWMTVGIALLSSEAFTGTFHLLFFGLSALMTAVFASLGLNQPVLQLLVFAVFSVGGVVLLRKRLVNRSKGFEGDADNRVQLSAALASGGEATIQYQGVPWTAKNISKKDLAVGEMVRIVRTEGIKLMVEPDWPVTPASPSAPEKS